MPDFNPAYWVWGHEAQRPRVLHTMVRVRQLDRALAFYEQGLGMKVLNRYDFETGRFSIVFLAYEGYDQGGAIELTCNWDQADEYSHGSGYGHISVGVPDIQDMVQRLERHGGTVTVNPKPQAPGAPLLAFVKDPDGYSIELIQTCRN